MSNVWVFIYALGGIIGIFLIIAGGTWFITQTLRGHTLRSRLLKVSLERGGEHRRMRLRTDTSLFEGSPDSTSVASGGGTGGTNEPTKKVQEMQEIRYLQEILEAGTVTQKSFYASVLFREGVEALLNAYSESNFLERMMKVLIKTEPIDKIQLFLTEKDKENGIYFKTYRVLAVHPESKEKSVTLLPEELPENEVDEAPLFFGKTETLLNHLEPFITHEKQGTQQAYSLFLPLFTPLPAPVFVESKTESKVEGEMKSKAEVRDVPALLGCLKLKKDFSDSMAKSKEMYFPKPSSYYAQLTLFMANAHACMIGFSGERTDNSTGFLTETYLEFLLRFILREQKGVGNSLGTRAGNSLETRAENSLAENSPPIIQLGILTFSFDEKFKPLVREHLKRFPSLLAEKFPEVPTPVFGTGKYPTRKIYLVSTSEAGIRFLTTQFLAEIEDFLTAALSTKIECGFNLHALEDASFKDFFTL